MADRYYSNTDQGQRFQPGTTVEAGQVDQKFDEVTAGFQEVAADTDRSLKLPAVTGTSQELDATPLQRRRKVVGFDADGNLTLLQGFGWRGNWTAATEYFVNDVFRDPATKNIYVIVTRHTSAAALSTDIAAGRVELAISVEEVEVAKTAAQAAATTATTKAGEASTSASQSATARNKAELWADEDEDTAVETGQFSAKHHAIKSAASASASSSTASQSATARDKSQAWAETAEDAEVETGQFSAKHHALKSAASASASSTSAGESATARDDSQTARDKAEEWAEAEGEVEPGKRSAKYWAGQAEEVAAGNLPITSLQPGTLTAPKDYVSVDENGALVKRNLANDVSEQVTEQLAAGDESASLSRIDYASVATQTVLDFAVSNSFRVDATGTDPITLTFTNLAALGRTEIGKINIIGNTAAIIWPAEIDWDEGDEAPQLGEQRSRVLIDHDNGAVYGCLSASK